MPAILADLRQSLRVLRASPLFLVLAAGTLALGIGATTAMFSVVDGVLLRPFPVKAQAQILVVWTTIPDRGFAHWPFSYASYLGLRDRLHMVSGIAAHPSAGALGAVLHRDDGSAMPLQQAIVTGDWFDVLGARAIAGRLLTPDDDHPGAPPVTVLSSAMAARLFGGPDAAVGRRLRIDEDTRTVVGVAPAGLEYPKATDAWVPAVKFRDSPYLAWDLVVRIAPGFTAAQVVDDFTSAMRTLSRDSGPLGDILPNQIISARPFAEAIVGDVRPALLLIGGGVLLTLIVAGLAVANLLIVRGLGRRRELAVRAAIGATRSRLVGHLSVEAVVLAVLAAAAATVIAAIVLKILFLIAPAELPRLASIAIDRRALLFTATLAMILTVGIGILPALSTAHVDPADTLRAFSGGTTAGAGPFRLRYLLVTAQIAVSVVVVSTAGLLLRSVDRLQRLDLGFAPHDLFLAEIAIPPARRPEPADAQRAMARLAEVTASQPGITGATAVSTPPFAGTQGVDATIHAEGQPFADGRAPIVNYEGVDAAYFSTLGLPIVRGRAIDGRDRATSELVVVVNEAFAHLFWPGQDPLGRRVKLGSITSKDAWRTVVGLVRDTRYRELTFARPSLYVPYAQGIPVTPSYVAIRAGSAAAAAGAIRRTLTAEEPTASVVRLDPLPRLLAAPLARPRFQTLLVASFAALGLILSAVGTYGTLAFLVRQRRRELGIRLALGATPQRLRVLVLRHGLALGATGVGVGLAAAVAVGRMVQPLLFDVSGVDAVVLTGAGGMLFAAVLLASVLPTRAATRCDPLLVLRSE